MTTDDSGVDRYALSGDQLRFFDENGYLVLPGLIPPDVVERLRRAADGWIRSGHSPDGLERRDYRFADRPSGRVMFRIDYVHNKGGRASLELLGCPEILGVAQSLAGPNFVPTYESLVFKDEDDGAPVYWHQDATHPRHWRITNVDIYLDESLPGAGALRVVPGSHRAPADVCTLERTYGWEVPGAIEVPMQPGDVLLHDVMVVHGSPPVRGNRMRRTLYYEFRAAEQILAEGPWDEQWIDRRMRLVPLALAEHARARPDAPQFDWRPDDRWRPAPAQDEAEELRVAHLVHTPGTFCSAGDVLTARTAR